MELHPQYRVRLGTNVGHTNRPGRDYATDVAVYCQDDTEQTEAAGGGADEAPMLMVLVRTTCLCVLCVCRVGCVW